MKKSVHGTEQIDREHSQHHRIIRNTIIYFCLGLLCVFAIFVMLWVLNNALKSNREYFATTPWSVTKIPQFVNFLIAWNKGMGRMFFNSLFLSVAGTVLSVSISCLAAYPIARIDFRFNQAVLTFILMGMMVPVMLTYIPVYFVISKIRQAIPIHDFVVLISLYTCFGFAFNTYVLTTTFKTLPKEFEEAGAIDGATPFQTFIHIMVPLAKPGLVAVSIFSFLNLWNEFYFALLFTKDRANHTVSIGLVFLEQQAVYSGRWPYLFAAAIISILPVLIIFGLLQDQVAKGLTAGAIKG